MDVDGFKGGTEEEEGWEQGGQEGCCGFSWGCAHGPVPFCMQTPVWPYSQCWGEVPSPPAAAITQIWGGEMLQQHLQANPVSQSSTQLDYLCWCQYWEILWVDTQPGTKFCWINLATSVCFADSCWPWCVKYKQPEPRGSLWPCRQQNRHHKDTISIQNQEVMPSLPRLNKCARRWRGSMSFGFEPPGDQILVFVIRESKIGCDCIAPGWELTTQYSQTPWCWRDETSG